VTTFSLHGYETTGQIKADPNLRGNADHRGELVCPERRRGKARAAGCDHYVTKPYNPMQLIRVIRQHLGE
jgi:two-component system cell cycle response regulator DivK